ncbi:MAG: PQQ-dependent sugar dehydrogenase, partial [Bacillota bacterium]
PNDQVTIDRQLVEYPAETELKPYVTGLTAPTAIAFDNEGSMLIAESGIGGREPRIFGFKKDGETFEIYPRRQLPSLPIRIPGIAKFKIYPPIGGMVAAHGRVYVSHRDENGQGTITAFSYDGSHTTIVAKLPAQGDYSVTDLAMAADGRLYFGLGTATNSAVVGIDNMHWLREYRDVCDLPAQRLYLLGRRFDAENPFAGLFGGTDIAVTAPFQPFGRSLETVVPEAPTPNGAIYSVSPTGGDMKIIAHGIRNPVGLGFSELGVLYATNQGMKLRGTRPVKDDPDVMLRVLNGQWYGWPDFSANLLPIRDPRFQPPVEMIVKSGYRDLSFLIDHAGSGLTPPNPNSNLLAAEFRPLAGAAKFDFAPPSGFFSRLRETGNVAVVALWGDRAPYDTGGRKLTGPMGYKVVQVNVDGRGVKDFVHNTQTGPASMHDLGGSALERPVDVKFGPDGALYILDFGRMEMKGGRERVRGGTGRVYKLVGVPQKK